MRYRGLFFLAFPFLLAACVLEAATLDDAVTNLKVRTALLEKFGADALGIRIDAAGSRVVLAGAVDRKETRDGARSAALGVKGVATVDDRLTLGNGPASKTRSGATRAKRNWENSLLEGKVKARLFEQVGENAWKIEVRASGGVVTLRGTVPTAPIHATALDATRGTGGVARVVDDLAGPR